MAASPYVWGIDIGKCGLKALRCRAGDDPRTLVADAFDYIEYPMILTQPEADPVELVRAALQDFIGRNKLRGDKVAVSVPGQSGLAKFIKLPPIEAKKIPDIVRYEARQQIPFPLDQVIWDWQRLAGGIEESGFVIDAEVAVFAMKKEQVAKALAPLQAADVDVDILQLSPIALANMVIFDQLPDPATIDPDSPPESVVLVSMGVDSTDLVITNGLRIWQRSMPIGGSNFTKALVTGMKLTFAKAEQLKRNAVRAEDPKAVFNAMRPVFNEFASELQRSLNYFTGSDRTAKIGKVLLLGNAARLRGLSDFVGKQLNLDVQRLDTFRGLDGAAVTSAAAFKEHRLAFGTAYGLALQGVGRGTLGTNLLPGEILRERLIESKKPWAVAAMVGVIAASALSFIGNYSAWTTWSPSLYDSAFKAADGVKSESQAAQSFYADMQKKQEDAVVRQQDFVKLQDRRFQVLDMLRSVESILPHDEPGATPESLADRRELHIDSMDCQYYADLDTWFSTVKEKWSETHPSEDAEELDEGRSAAPAAEGSAAPGEIQGPKGPGWVIQLVGYHYHNEDHHKPDQGAQFLRSTIIKGLLGKGDEVAVSAGPLAGQTVSIGDLGVGFPVIVSSSPLKPVPNPLAPAGMPGVPGMGGMTGMMPPGMNAPPGMMAGGRPFGAGGRQGGRGAGAPKAGGENGGGPADAGDPAPGKDAAPGDGGETPGAVAQAGADGQGQPPAVSPMVRRYDFIVQFAWQPKVPGTEKPADEAEGAPGQ
ncbi:MAG: type IV pilus assembly protein PilM [Planctomycetes bacterium]|nr:type IV pilus assembly protein PilM [Planctomycetota bacterium]